MKYLLDTNICIYIIKERPKQVLVRLVKKNPDEIAISSITWSELFYGIEKSQYRDKNLKALRDFSIPFTILDWGKEEAEIMGRVRKDLQRTGKMIGAFDLMIAAQALARGLILVTNNEREFRRIEDLKIENWV